MKETPYLDFYYKCMEDGLMPKAGLCKCLGKGKIKLFKPTLEEFGLNHHASNVDDYFWGITGSLGMSVDDDPQYGFTPLRQTIVLFLAAMNGEL